jgi:hypothetical protein
MIAGIARVHISTPPARRCELRKRALFGNVARDLAYGPAPPTHL